MSTARCKHHTVASAKKGDFFLKREKREGVFCRQLKNGMYEGFMLHKEIYYINIHINCLQMFLTKLGIMLKDIKLAKIQSSSLP